MRRRAYIKSVTTKGLRPASSFDPNQQGVSYSLSVVERISAAHPFESSSGNGASRITHVDSPEAECRCSPDCAANPPHHTDLRPTVNPQCQGVNLPPVGLRNPLEAEEFTPSSPYLPRRS